MADALRNQDNNDTEKMITEHIDPHVHVLEHGELSQSSQSSTSTTGKRSLNSPSAEQSNKQYRFDSNELLKQNKYYLAPQYAKSLDDNPKHLAASEPKTEKPKIPPIFIHEAMNYHEIVKDIKSHVTDKFTLSNKGTQLKINLESIEDYRTLTAYYESEKNVKFHTFQNPDSNKISVIIRNIPTSITSEEIQQELLDKEYEVINVTRLYIKKKPIPICAVTLTKNEKAKHIYSLENLCYCKITIEPRRKTRDIPQCTRCQRFSHTKNYCHLSPRCVKCLGDHLTNQCTQNKDIKPRCVNCEGQHTANYRGCEYYKKLARTKNSISYSSTTRPNETNMPNYPPSRDNINYPTLPGSQIPETRAETTHNKWNTFRINKENSATSDTKSIGENLIELIIKVITPYLGKIKDLLLSLIPALLNNGGI